MAIKQAISSLSAKIILAHVAAIAQQMQQTTPLDTLLQTAIAELRANLGSDRVIIYRVLSHQDAVVQYESVAPAWLPIVGQLIYDPCFESLWIERYQQGATTAIADVHDSSLTPCHVELLDSLQVQANLVVPLVSQGKLWGLLIAHQCSGPRHWTLVEKQYMQQVALHLGLAIQHDVTLQQTSHHVQSLEHQLEQRSQQLQTTEALLRDYKDSCHLALQRYQVACSYHPAESVLHRYERMFASILDGVALVDRHYTYQLVNQTYVDWNHKPYNAIVGHSISELWGADFFATCKPLIDRCLGGETNLTAEAWVEYADGQRRFVQATYTPYVERDYAISGVVVNLHDLSDLKRVEEALQFNQAKYQALVMNMPGMVYRYFPHTRDRPHAFTFVSEQAQDLLGLRPEEVIADADNFVNLIHPDDLSSFLETVAEAVANFLPWHWEGRIITPSGQQKWIQGHSQAQQSPEGAAWDGLLVDISERARLEAERQQAVAQLQEQEERWQLALQGNNDGIWDWNIQTNEVFFSSRWKSMLGYGEDEIANHLDEWSQRVHPDDLNMVMQLIQDHFEQKTPFYISEHRLLCKDGQYKWILDRGKVQWAEDGHPKRMAGSHTDITDRKQAEAQLQNLSDRLNLAAQSAKLGIWDWDIASDRLCWDERMYTLYGVAATDFSGAYGAWERGVHPDDLPRCQRLLQAALDDHCKFETEFRVILPDGTVRYLEAYAIVQRDDRDRPLRMIGVNRDISDRKAAEIALRESEARYRSVITAMTEGIVLQQADGKIIACNASAERILGVSRNEMMSQTAAERNWYTIHSDGSFFPQEMHPAIVTLKTGQPQTNVVMGICKPTGIVWISVNSQPLFDTNAAIPSAVVASFTDITELKQAEFALRQQAERERLLTEIAQHIRQTLDLNEILNTTVTEVQQFLQTDRVIVYRFDADWSGVVIAEAVAPEWNSILGWRIADSYLMETQGYEYRHGRIQTTDDIYTVNFHPCHIALLEEMQVRAKLVVPILQGEDLWGLLMAHHCNEPRHWQQLEVDLLQQLATQIAIAIQQSELHQQVQQLNTNLEQQVQLRTTQLELAFEFEATLKRITDKVRDSLDEAQIMQTAVRELAQALRISCCNTSIYDLEQRLSTVSYEYSTLHCSYVGRILPMANYPEIYNQLLQGEAFQCCSLRPNVDRGEVMMLAYPIADDQGVLGDLWLINQKYYLFDEQDIRLVQQVANQCAIALRQSRLYQAAQAQVKELECLNQLKDDFLSTVSHELRTPMSSIKMATQMLEISLEPLGVFEDEDAPIHRYFKVLREEGQREISLINDLLDLARLDAGTEPLQWMPIALQFFVPHLAEPFTERALSQQQEIIVAIDPELPQLTTDLPYLERILTELLHNACKYTPTGEKIIVTATTVGDRLELCVSNSGVEIPRAACDRVFDKFYRVPNNDPWKHGGTGLGLALVKKLTERLAGTIRVTSGNHHTTFILTFPFAPAAIGPADTTLKG